eukprot:m.11415 g.11415  ORF g.11415 m.11415 type:complete len:55 (-) comp4437_c0_seq1:68-232(-)
MGSKVSQGIGYYVSCANGDNFSPQYVTTWTSLSFIFHNNIRITQNNFYIYFKFT